MKKLSSEQIGYLLEHLLILELSKRNIESTRSEKVTNEAIKSDISFLINNKKFVIFVTHQKSQGMTNRKFYRSFEELAQRRIQDTEAICINFTLSENVSKVRLQQVLIFDGFFDHSLSLLNEEDLHIFYDFVELFKGGKISLKLVEENLGRLPSLLKVNMSNTVDKVLMLDRDYSHIDDYWKLESKVERRPTFFSVSTGISIKYGLKILTLIPEDLLKFFTGSTSLSFKKNEITDDILEYLEEIDAIYEVRSGVVGIKAQINPCLISAIKYLQNNNFDLKFGWVEKYLATFSAKTLYKDIFRKSELREEFSVNSNLLSSVKDENQLYSIMINEYNDKTKSRCYFIEYCLLCSGYSQQSISTDLLSVIDFSIAQDGAINYIITKNNSAENIIRDLDQYIKLAANLIYERILNEKYEADFSSYFYRRIKTYYSNQSVKVENLILETITNRDDVCVIHKSRGSVLPRLLDLSSNYSMSVIFNNAIRIKDSKDVYITSISTPEKRHHKHKEFSGKLRAVRYKWSEKALVNDNAIYIAILDGNWSEEQISMLSISGWIVCDWDGLVDAIGL